MQFSDRFFLLIFFVQNVQLSQLTFCLLSQFILKLPYKPESIISYLQPGVEYCVSVSVSSRFNKNSVSSVRRCSFTSPPPDESSRTFLVLTCNKNTCRRRRGTSSGCTSCFCRKEEVEFNSFSAGKHQMFRKSFLNKTFVKV